MATTICVADVRGSSGVPRGIFSSGFPTDGCPAVLVVNLGEVKTLTQLTAALAALPTYSASEYFSAAKRPPRKSEPAVGVQDTGPFDAYARPPTSSIVAFSYKSGWSAAAVAASMRPYSLGSIGGPHAVALVIDHELPGAASAQAALIAGATTALTGTLS